MSKFAYTASWEDGMDANYDSLSEIIADVVQTLAEEENWEGVEWWGRIMSSGEFDAMSLEESIQCILEKSDVVKIIDYDKERTYGL